MTARIGLFSTDFARKGPFKDDAISWGGVGEVVYQLATRLNDRGYEIIVFTSSPGGRERTTVDGLTLVDFGTQIPIGKKHISLSMLVSHLSKSVDIVHTHRGLPSGAIAGAVHSHFRDVPHVVTVHGDLHYVSGKPIRNILLRGFERLSPQMLCSAGAVTTVSESFRSSSTYLDAVREETIVVPNGTKTRQIPDMTEELDARERLNLPMEDNIVLFLGTLEPRKHPGTLLSAVPRILDTHPDTQFVFVGGGSLLSELQSRVADQNFRDRVMFKGFVSESEKNKYYLASDVFCLPSADEANPLAPLEAAAHGLPLVLGDIPVFNEVFGDAATLVEPSSHEAIKTSISELLGAPERRTRMSERSWAVAEKYSWEEMVNGYESVYKAVLSS